MLLPIPPSPSSPYPRGTPTPVVPKFTGWEFETIPYHPVHYTLANMALILENDYFSTTIQTIQTIQHHQQYNKLTKILKKYVI
jgi:hypothetical protein